MSIGYFEGGAFALRSFKVVRLCAMSFSAMSLIVLSLSLYADEARTNSESSADLPASMRLSGGNIQSAETQSAAAQSPDRTSYWVPSFDRVRSRLDRDFASLPNAQRLAITHERSVAEQDIARAVASKTRPWSSSDAIDVYRRIVRLAYLGNRESPFVRAIASSIPPAAIDKSFVTVQNRVSSGHPTMRWSAGSYVKVESTHFEITTQGTPELAERVAILAEQIYAVWQQAFLPAWCDPRTLESAILDGKPFQNSASQLSDRRLQIVLFKNRDQYVRGLREIQPNIGISTGFYHPGSATVFCYWDENVSANVLKHEITHQLFSEASRWEPIVVDSIPKNFWIIEGVALYMESMLVDPAVGCDRVTLGGWDSPRLQPARYRRLHDEFWIPWDEFTRGTSQTFQKGEAVGQHYSQAAGLTHFWMDHSSASRSGLMDFLCDVYEQKTEVRPLRFSEDDEIMRGHYDQFLLDAGTLSRTIPPRPVRKDVVLSRTDVTSDVMLGWPTTTAVKLDWLDLSFTKIDDSMWTASGIGLGGGRWDTRRLNVEGTRVSDNSIPSIASNNRLEELDLSTCKISDAGLEPLRGHRSLRKLWLTGTNVSDSLIDLLASLPRLEEVELTDTRFTVEGRQELARRIPKLRKK